VVIILAKKKTKKTIIKKKTQKKKVVAKKAPKKKAVSVKRPSVKTKLKKPVPKKRVVVKKKIAMKPTIIETPKKGRRPEPTIEVVKIPTAEQKVEMKKILGILRDAYIRQTLIEVGGENALAIVRNFYGDNSDEELAKKLKIKISDVRATLNKLHNEGLVNYIRQKDSETGWYSYSWTLNHVRMKKWASDQTNKVINAGNEESENYYCPSCGTSTIASFEDAVTGDFRCTQCNRMLEFLDKEKMIEIYERKRL
jgi:transcription initiation factor TFIIE subunit alpha